MAVTGTLEMNAETMAVANIRPSSVERMDLPKSFSIPYRMRLEMGELETASDMPKDARMNRTGGVAMPLMAAGREAAAPVT